MGDLIQNCRAILDHIFSALVDAAGGDSSRAYFPLFKDRRPFNEDTIPKLVKYGLGDGEIALLESLQPFNGVARPVENHPAWVLHELSNIDKHHAVTTQIAAQDALNMSVRIGAEVIDLPRLRRPVILDPDGETEIAELHLATVPEFAGAWVPVEMKGQMDWRLYVEGRWPLTLASYGVATWVKDDVLTRFEPILKKLG